MRHMLRRVLHAVVAGVVVAALGVAGTAGLGGTRALASGPPAGSLTAGNLQSAYGFPSATEGSGRTVAVVTVSDDRSAEADLAAYRSFYGLPACTTANGCFLKVNENGSSTSLPPAGPGTATAQGLDAVSAVCPNCYILLVEAGTTYGIADLGTAVNEAVTLGAQFIDVGYSAPEAEVGTRELTYDAQYFNHPGVVITAPSGDSKYGVSYPAASPDVVAVGGSVLTPDASTSRGWDEAMWPSSGSGCSQYEAKPRWQADAGCSGRMLNDVSAVAANVAYYDTSATSGWAVGAGTAISAAVIAAAFALAGSPAGSPASALYGNTQGLYDITTGANGVTTNGTCPVAYWCTVGPGYDGPTGLGSPSGVSAFTASYYVPVTPVRVLDTRNGTGGIAGPVGPGGQVGLAIAGLNGIPPANVTAVAINITALGGTTSGFIDAYPDPSCPPSNGGAICWTLTGPGHSPTGTSNIDYAAGQTIANLAIVPLGRDGGITLYNGGSGTVQLLGDVSGYFTSDPGVAGVSTYTPVNPIRILNTLNGIGAPKAPLAGDTTLALQVAGANGIPSGVSAVVINMTTVNETSPGYLTEWADGTSEPRVSQLQFGTTGIAELAVVTAVGADGKIDIRSDQTASNSTDVLGDVVGYFTPGATSGEAYRAVSLRRVFDTRTSSPVPSGGTMTVQAGKWINAPNPTLIGGIIAVPVKSGYLTVYPAGINRPGTSTIDFQDNTNIDNLDLISTGGGAFNIYNYSGTATNVVIDLQGYFSAG